MMDMSVLENRYLVMNGLRNINNVGLARILKGAKKDLYKLDGDAIGFGVAPLINGVARLDNIKLAIDIFMTDDDKEAKKLRLKMAKLNDERKEIQKDLFERYSKNIDASKKVLIVMDDHSSKGFNGLIAQQLSDSYKRPVIVGRLHDGTLSGSFRSFGGFDFKSFLQDSCLIKEAMGHPQAGGIVVDEENIDSLIEYTENNLPELNEKGKTCIYDVEINVDEVEEWVSAIQRYNLVTGTGFKKIVARVNGVNVEDVETIGKNEDTRKIKTFDSLELIKFRVDSEYASDISVFDEIDVVGTLGINEWFNFKTKEKIVTNQLMLEDYILSE